MGHIQAVYACVGMFIVHNDYEILIKEWCKNILTGVSIYLKTFSSDSSWYFDCMFRWLWIRLKIFSNKSEVTPGGRPTKMLH